jgi:hypothetical protein
MRRSVAAVIFGLAAIAAGGLAFAQNEPQELPTLQEIIGGEIPQESLDLALQLVRLSGNSQAFDELLPNIADETKNLFIRANPQMQLGIINIVDLLALTLVPRRPELDRQLARIWASGFTDEEMRALIAFYQTDAGKKFAEVYPKVLAVEVAAAQQWSRAVGEELTQLVGDELRQAIQAEQDALSGGTLPVPDAPSAETPPAEAPATPEAPAQ